MLEGVQVSDVSNATVGMIGMRGTTVTVDVVGEAMLRVVEASVGSATGVGVLRSVRRSGWTSWMRMWKMRQWMSR